VRISDDVIEFELRMSERGKGVSSEPLWSPLLRAGDGVDCWAEKPTSPNYPLNWLLGGGHEEKWRIRGIDGDIQPNGLD